MCLIKLQRTHTYLKTVAEWHAMDAVQGDLRHVPLKCTFQNKGLREFRPIIRGCNSWKLYEPLLGLKQGCNWRCTGHVPRSCTFVGLCTLLGLWGTLHRNFVQPAPAFGAASTSSNHRRSFVQSPIFVTKRL